MSRTRATLSPQSNSFLAISCSCHFRRLDPILLRPLFCISRSSSFETRVSYNHFHGLHRKHSLYFWRSLLSVPLPKNRRPIIVCSCLLGMCIPTRCRAIGLHLIMFYVCETINFGSDCTDNRVSCKIRSIGFLFLQSSSARVWHESIGALRNTERYLAVCFAETCY
jgi:hypothetical protein